MSTLFISHSSHDNAHAVKVRDWLKAEGWGDVFLDLDPAQGLAPGQRWQDELKRAGEKCAAVVVLVSPNWAASRWCQTEFLVADQLGKRVFPVFVEPTSFDDLPLELKAKFQLADISTPDKEAEGLQRLGIGLKRAGLDPRSFDWPPAGEPNRAAYRGLQALDVQDAPIFFGRDAAITRGLDELRRLRDGARQRMMVILGASGAGKSSFLRAGLLARLKRDEENFLVLPVVRPGRAVISGSQGLAACLSTALGRQVNLDTGADALVAALKDLRAPIVERLTRHAQAAREVYSAKPPTIVIPLDQAEELFSGDNTERALFCGIAKQALLADGNTLLVATIRSDSYEKLQNELLPDEQVLFTLPAIAAGSFQAIIEGPARLSKPPLTLEPELTQQLMSDLSAADALPLLAFTLENLSRRGVDGRVTAADYQKLGGLRGAIQSAVDAVLGNPPAAEKLAMARRLFVPALVQVSADGVRRRTAHRENLPPDTAPIAQAFIEQRLLVANEDRVDIAHEALLRQWPALSGWIAQEHEALAIIDGVRTAAKDWARNKSQAKADDGSWATHRGDRLRAADEIALRADFGASVDADMRAYLEACHTVPHVRRLVVLLDGSWTAAAAQDSSMKKLAASIARADTMGVGQQVFYSAVEINRQLMEAYLFLCWNYNAGDQIFIFGASRGGYSARALAGLIRSAGVLHRAWADRAAEAVKLYRKSRHSDSDANASFRKQYAYDPVPIAYLGVLDTVGVGGVPSSFGPAGYLINRGFQLRDLNLSNRVESARQALAIDEERAVFQPTLWRNLEDLNQDASADGDSPSAPYQQRWFPGAHDDVIGVSGSTLANEPLRWIAQGASQRGLVFSDGYSPLAKIGVRDTRDVLGEIDASKTVLNVAGKKARTIARYKRSAKASIADARRLLSEAAYARWRSANLAPPYRPKALKPFAEILNGGEESTFTER